MDKYRIQIDWLNKLYDDLYYADLEDSDQALDMINSMVSDKENEPIINDERNLTSIIIEVSEELADLLDAEGLMVCYNFIIDKIDKIQAGEFDEELREEYFPDLFDLENDDEISEDDFDELYEDVDAIEEEDTYIHELPEADLEYDEY